MKLKYKDSFIENVEKWSTLYEISKTVQKDFKFPIMCAKLDNILVDLNEVVNDNSKIEFYDRTTKTGNRVYERSLEFLVIAAVKDVLDADVFINYSLDNGIYCEIKDIDINSRIIKQIENKMRELVANDLPFTKDKINRLDAIKYFQKRKQLDKVNNLNYTINSTIDMCKLNNHYDYFFGPLAYSTKDITDFELHYIKNNFFVVNYPSIKEPNKVSDYIDRTYIFDKYKEYEAWSEKVGIRFASDLNKWETEGKYTDAINVFETHFENELSKMSEDIYQKKEDIKVILLSGPSSSGKTTTSKELSLYLKAKGLNAIQISLDNYLKERQKIPKDKEGNYDFDHISATDVELFNKHLKELLKGKKVDIPRHDFKTGANLYEKDFVQVKENDILLIEGTHALNDKLTKGLERKEKYKIFITPLVWLKIDNHNRIRSTDLRKLRRIVRDNRYRSTTAEETLKMWHNVDIGTFDNIYPFQDDVDYVINSSLNYEIGVLRIFAEPLLYGIERTSEVYDEAIRLINLLRQFLPISSEDVPKDSILREFIGEGLFN